VTSLREIKLLREIECPHVVRLLDVFPHKRKLNMVRVFVGRGGGEACRWKAHAGRVQLPPCRAPHPAPPLRTPQHTPQHKRTHARTQARTHAHHAATQTRTPRHTTPHHTTPHHTTPHHTTPHHTTPHHTTPHHTTPHHTTPHHTTPHHTTPHHTTPHHTTPHHATPRHTTPHHATPRHTTPHRTPHHTARHTPHQQVFEFMDSDLEALIKAKGVVLSPADVKAYVAMMLRGLASCHRHWVLHRDVKPNNMLISRDGARMCVVCVGGGGWGRRHECGAPAAARVAAAHVCWALARGRVTRTSPVPALHTCPLATPARPLQAGRLWPRAHLWQPRPPPHAAGACEGWRACLARCSSCACAGCTLWPTTPASHAVCCCPSPRTHTRVRARRCLRAGTGRLSCCLAPPPTAPPWTSGAQAACLQVCGVRPRGALQAGHAVHACLAHGTRDETVLGILAAHTCEVRRMCIVAAATCAMSHVPCHVCHVTCAMSHVPCRMCHATCAMSRVPCRMCRATTHAELLLRRPWFPGSSDIDQLGKIFAALGTPTKDSWPGALGGGGTNAHTCCVPTRGAPPDPDPRFASACACFARRDMAHPPRAPSRCGGAAVLRRVPAVVAAAAAAAVPGRLGRRARPAVTHGGAQPVPAPLRCVRAWCWVGAWGRRCANTYAGGCVATLVCAAAADTVCPVRAMLRRRASSCALQPPKRSSTPTSAQRRHPRQHTGCRTRPCARTTPCRCRGRWRACQHSTRAACH
jgi:hypothetical protein